MEDPDRRPVAIGRPIVKFFSDFYVIYICTSHPSPVFKSTPNSQIYVLFHILKCMTISHVLKSTSTDLCPYPNSNQ